MNITNEVWKDKLRQLSFKNEFTPKPRGMLVNETLGGQYRVPIPAYLDLKNREVNVKFMFAEAAWIISGSNKLSDITPYMKSYGKYSDDGVFMRGAYGPKIVDQLGYIVDTLEKDNDSRQAVLNIWRERPGESKDIPCTTQMQFFIREGDLHLVVTMRSNDIVLGFTYDVFTFSMVAKSIQLLLKSRGIEVNLGDLFVNAGSLHLYETHFEDVDKWMFTEEIDETIKPQIDKLNVDTYEELIKKLWELADD